MVLLNVLVVSKEDSKVLLGWEIIRSLSPEATFESLFHEKLVPRINPPHPQSKVKLDSCFIGKEKHCLDKTDVSFLIADVSSMFEPFVKLFAVYDQPTNPRPPAPVRNAFSIMMMAQQRLSVPVVPSRIPARTKKDELYNDVVDVLEQENLKLPRVDENGKWLLKVLTNALWYIDGRHETLLKRPCKRPCKVPRIQPTRVVKT